MNIHFIANARLPSRSAESIFTMKMCQAMAQEGHRVHLIAIKPPGGGSSDRWDLTHYYGLTERFPVTRIPAMRGLHLQGRDYSLRAALLAWRSRTDLVYTRNPGSAAVAVRLGLPTILEAHRPGVTPPWPLSARAMLRSPHLKAVVVLTKRLKLDFLSRYAGIADKAKILVIPDGVDVERFAAMPSSAEAKRRLGIPASSFVAGYVGHLYKGRGFELILELARRFPTVTFLIVGGEPSDVARRQGQVRDAGVDNIDLRGFVPNAELPAYYAACDVLLMPYQRRVEVEGGGDTSRWMSPMKMFEYMAAGRLIISSDLPVIREVLSEENAVLCPPEDTGAWAAALRRAMTDGTWRTRLAAGARAEAERYTWRNRVRRVLTTALWTASGTREVSTGTGWEG